jgi:multidrug efflux system membrane fusion protein
MVSTPIEDTVTDFEEVTGRTWAINTIEIRSRVSGYLDKVYFKDGSIIKAGDLLFEIDQRPFKADLDRAIAAVKQGEAHLERLVRQEERMKKLLPSKAITMDEFEAITFERAEAEAILAAAKAAEETAQLNLSFTRVTSKISGTIGRRLVDPGNLVKADDTALASVVELNPIYAYFDLDERTVLRLRRMIQDGSVKSPQDVELTAQVAVADDPDYTMTGVINFIDNQLDGSTGTLRGRALVDNHDGLLSPGLFVRLRVPIGAAHKAILVREEALGSDQGQRFVYVIDKVKNKDTGVEEDVVAYRRVKIGTLVGGRRVIESGLALNERVIVTGLQRVRPGAKVVAKMVDKDGKVIDQAAPGATKTAEVAHGSGK